MNISVKAKTKGSELGGINQFKPRFPNNSKTRCFEIFNRTTMAEVTKQIRGLVKGMRRRIHAVHQKSGDGGHTKYWGPFSGYQKLDLIR